MNILSRIRKAFKNFEKKVEGFFRKIEKKVEVFFGKPKPQEKEVKKPEEEGKPVTLTVSVEMYTGNKTEKIDIVRQFPSRQDALQNVEALAIEILNQNRSKASSIAKSVNYRIDNSVEEKYLKKVVADVHKQKK
jgi:hypothetical protein